MDIINMSIILTYVYVILDIDLLMIKRTVAQNVIIIQFHLEVIMS